MDTKRKRLETTFYRFFKKTALRNIPNREDSELVRKVLLLNGTLSVGICVLILLGSISFFQKNFLLGYLDYAVALLLLVLLLLIHFRQQYTVCCYTGIAIIHCLYFFVFVTGAAKGNAFMWYFNYPLFTLFLLGTRNGSRVIMLLFVPTLIFLAIDLFVSKVPLYDMYFASRFIPSFITVFLFSHLYEKSREKAYEELLAAHAHQEQVIQERTEKIKRQQAQIAHADRLTALGEMATGIAHEINQPLTIISLAEQHLRRKWQQENGLDTASKESLETIALQVKRATTIICNMRSFARTSEEVMTEIDIVEPVQTALAFFQEQFRIHQISIETSFAGQLPKVKLNSQKMEQIVVNLLSNARFALEKQAESAKNGYEKHISMRLYAQENGADVVLEVEDNGIGMSAEVLEHCQEPFFTTKDVGQGTGLGLSILRNIVSEFDGTFEIESVSGQGSVFRILLPGGEHDK